MNSLLAGFDTKVGFMTNRGLIDPSANRPQIYCNKVLSQFYADGKVVSISSAGAGISREEAEICSFYEGIERYAFRNPTSCHSNRIINSDKSADQKKLLPSEFNFFTDEQKAYSVIAKHIECKNSSNLWIKGEQIAADTRVESLVPLGAVMNDSKGSFFQNTTNGMAAGQNMDQAQYSALCEAIERDAFMYSWFAMEKLVEFDYLKYIKEDYKLRILWQKLSPVRDFIKVRLIPTILGDYSVVASFQNQKSDSLPFFSMGMAYRPSLNESIYKALIELAQLLLSSQARNQKDWNMVKDYDDKSKSSKDSSDVYSFQESEDLLGSFHHSADTQPSPRLMGQQSGDIKSVLNACSQRNIRIYAIDLTLPDVRQLGAVVCKVISPELLPLNLSNHLKPYGHKRLSQVQVLNKFPHPFS